MWHKSLCLQLERALCKGPEDGGPDTHSGSSYCFCDRGVVGTQSMGRKTVSRTSHLPLLIFTVWRALCCWQCTIWFTSWQLLKACIIILILETRLPSLSKGQDVKNTSPTCTPPLPRLQQAHVTLSSQLESLGSYFRAQTFLTAANKLGSLLFMLVALWISSFRHMSSF